MISIEKPLSKNIEYSIVVPVYRGAMYLDDLYNRIVKVMGDIGANFEIVFVDDCSPDNSWEILESLSVLDSEIKLIQLSKNYGQHAATICGFTYCEGLKVITLDDDLQHPPEEIPKLIEELDNGFQLVYGKYQKKKHGWFRNLCSKWTNQILSRVTNSRYDLTSFRIMDCRIAKEIAKMASPSCILDILAFHVIPSNSISYVTVRHENYQTTNYNLKKLISIGLDIILNYTVFPLRIASIIGIFISGLSFMLSLYYLIRFLSNKISVSGFATTVLLTLFFSGIIIFILGLIGEYIGRIFLTIHKKPVYVVKQIKI